MDIDAEVKQEKEVEITMRLTPEEFAGLYALLGRASAGSDFTQKFTPSWHSMKKLVESLGLDVYGVSTTNERPGKHLMERKSGEEDEITCWKFRVQAKTKLRKFAHKIKQSL